MTDLHVLLVEDDVILGRSMVQRLELEGFVVIWARTAAQADKLLGHADYDVMLSDIRLPDGDGADVMRGHFARLGLVPVIFMTAYGDIDQAVSLVRDGAWDYLAKPFDLDALVERLGRLAENRSRAVGSVPGSARSPAMRATHTVLLKAARTSLPVTLLGETGTGKEVAARMLHDNGPNASGPFVPVNAGLLHSDMTESLLFGHERGAFTGASARHMGFIEEAGTGTFFLDEVGELDLAMQVKLLRLLDQNTFRRLGGTHDLPFKARVICATNRNLEAMVARGEFRQDLWYRINVVTVTLPPLRDRPEDIQPLIEDRLRRAAQEFGRTVPRLADAAREQALNYGWPGNIRELVNRVDRAVAMSDTSEIAANDLFPDLAAESRQHPSRSHAALTLIEAREAAEHDHILSALETNDWKIQPTADQLGISRTTLWERMKRFGIDPER